MPSRTGGAPAPAPSGAAREQAPGRTGGRGADSHTKLDEKLIRGVPARIMRPRLVFIACLVSIVCFGVVMVYSASSVEALQETGSSIYYFIRQLVFAAAGGVIAVVIARVPALSLENLRERIATALLVILIPLLIVVFAFTATGGAHRWIPLGFMSLQPSEFAKPVVILLAASAFERYFGEHSLDGWGLLVALVWGVILPLALIFFEPDLGSTLIIVITLFSMAVLAGMPGKTIIGIGLAIVAAGVIAMFAAPYRVQRYLAALDPWQDEYGTGYQATLGIMAFASGGLFGRGIGNSTMKYNYLPEAHNDFILAIIGEELGLVGTVIFIGVFMLMIWSAFKIAEQSPSRYGRLVASGCATILCIQFYVNALGILGVTPMTGKTLPFISYGGSSMISCLMLAGLIIRVSMESFEGNPYARLRSGFSVMDEADPGADVSSHLGRSTAGEARPRSAQAGARGAVSGGVQAGQPSRSGFSVYDGGASAPLTGRSGSAPRAGRGEQRGGYERIDLNADPSERLRPSRSARPVRRDDSRGSSGRGRGYSGGSNSGGRNRHDR